MSPTRKFLPFAMRNSTFGCLALPSEPFVFPQPMPQCAVYPTVPKGDGLLISPIGSQDGSLLAFVSNRQDLTATASISNADRNVELFANKTNQCTSPTATNVISLQVTSSSGNIFGGYNLAPSVNYSGMRIAFISDRNFSQNACRNCSNPDANFEVFVADVSESNAITLTQVTSTTAGASTSPAISADGNYVAFLSDARGLVCEVNCTASGGRLHIYRADLRNLSNTTHITSFVMSQVTPPSGASNADYDFPMISSNGATVVYVTNVADVEAGNAGNAYEVRQARYNDPTNCTQLGWPVQWRKHAQKAPVGMSHDAVVVVFTSPDAKAIIS
ncbi:MAG: hypothetical protein HC853_01380 [Anaerolineae bacterium]|nr:hypothetical protein [Anaerolineae bacterium]